MAPTETAYISRAEELDAIFGYINDAECCAVVGLSNMGKSHLLRSLAFMRPLVADDNEHIFVYIDFNLMVEMTEQAFYELILRSTISMLARLDLPAPLRDQLRQAYDKVIDSDNAFLIPLGFNEGIVTLCEELGRRFVYLFDEFDGPFREIEPRVFLNLRALVDRYPHQLIYVVATNRRLNRMRGGSEIGEFCELFAHQTLHLGPLNHNDVQHAVSSFMSEEGLPVTPHDIDFVWQTSGGHPGLLQAVCHVLASIGGIEDEHGDRLARDKLDSDINVRAECIKLWNGLGTEEQRTLIDFGAGKGIERAELDALVQMGLLRAGGEYAVFGSVFAGFVRRQRLAQSPYPLGVRVDAESGEVWVDGEVAPTLTELEYRALLLFYGRMDQICDKYEIVEAVWGEDYIDEVDDARIEKLISRLRKKIESDPSEPKYLQTVRGRGYRLVSV
ncbi:MAG: winged helix-turn-helix domain-containing protein [Anaerolineae bacterium]|jgi:DNA-binding winged helix-turn-helix (wHTH) protein